MADPIEPQPADELRLRSLAIFYGIGGVALAGLILYVLALLWPVAVLVLISVMLSTALEPLVKRIQFKTNRKLATTLVVVGLLVAVSAAIVFTIPTIASQLDTLAGEFDRLFADFQSLVRQRSPQFANMLGQLKVASMPTTTEPQALKEALFQSFTVVTGFVTVLTLTSYLVVEGPSVASALVSVFPRRNRLQVRQMFGEIGDQVGAYIRSQITTSVLAGVVTYAILAAFGVPSAIAIAWIMAITNSIPVVGTILGMAPAVASAASMGSTTAIYVFVALLAYQQIESYWIMPKLYGKALQLSPLTVLISILVGAVLLGMVGAFIALPFAAMVPILLRHFNEWRASENAADAESALGAPSP